MTRVEATADVMRRAARGDCQCQIMMAMEILDIAEKVDPFTALFLEIQALCYARLAAAHGNAGALHFAAVLTAKIANHQNGEDIGIAVREMRADALAMLDVAADIAPPEDRDAMEGHLHALSASSDARTAELAQPHRKLWGLIALDQQEAFNG